ncbi:20221_t:CDS:2, partial [Dentiscutata erythropus]
MSHKRTTLTEIQKRDLCAYALNNKLTRAQYVNWIEEHTVSRILKTGEQRLSSEPISPDIKRHKSVTYPELELALKEFVLTYQNKTVLSDAILIEKAKLLAERLKIPQGAFQFSAGWLHKFKDRNGIRQRRIEGEAGSADETAINNALLLIKNRCSEYPLERIYNMDETRLFYRLEPDRTLATRRLSGRKMNKECLSVALCVNTNGSHKLDPLVIGKYQRPRCFKNIRIQNMPMKYSSNAKAWMISSLFQEWIQEFDHQVGQMHQGQRVLLLLDNCPSHILAGLTLHLMLQHVEEGNRAEDLRINILQAINFIIQAWDEISAETIHNCWCYTKILLYDINAERNASASTLANTSANTYQKNSAHDDLVDALQALRLSYPMRVEEFLNIPEEDVVYEAPEDDQIIDELAYLFRNANEDIDLDEADDSNESPIIGASTAMSSLETV